MPNFDTSYQTEKRVTASSHGDVTWVMSGEGYGVKPGGAFTAVWWINDAGDLYSGAQLSMSIRDGQATDALVVELWVQESMKGGGILVKSFTVAPVAGIEPSALRILGQVAAMGRRWGVRARMTSASARQVMFQLTFYCRVQASSGVLWLGEGVT